jgi:hypothetical protein
MQIIVTVQFNQFISIQKCFILNLYILSYSIGSDSIGFKINFSRKLN